MNREDNLRRLADEEFDLCIIGAGASGAGSALEAALKGMKVALIEKTDFAAETSGRSTKLIHGGVRYLEQAFKHFDFAQLRQVRHGLEERKTLLKNAPHLAHPIGLLTPVFSWWEGLYYWAGLKLYDWFAGRGNRIARSRWIGKKKALKLMPGLSGNIHSAVVYFDGSMDDARYCLALVQSANAEGAAVANHLEVTGFKKDQDGLLKSALVRDLLNPGNRFEVKADYFLNCTGPYADSIRQMANPALGARMRPSKGVHLLLPGDLLKSRHAMLIPKTRDGRLVFAVPFEGNLLLGTTDEPWSNLGEEPLLESKDVHYLLETLQPFISSPIDPDKVRAGFGGIRPLLLPAEPIFDQEMRRDTKNLLRDHEVELDEISGLFSLLGGKWTTYRLMAKDAVDFLVATTQWQASSLMKRTGNGSSQTYHLFGAIGYEPGLALKIHAKYGWDEKICQHLASKYGVCVGELTEMAEESPELQIPIISGFPFLKVEIEYAVKMEMAMTIRDFLARRIRLESTDWFAAKRAAPEVGQRMGHLLGWPETKIQEEINAYLQLIDGFMARSGLHEHP